MKCRICGASKHVVSSTRGWLDAEILRTRTCVVCGYGWSTTESIDTDTDCLRRITQMDDALEYIESQCGGEIKRFIIKSTG